MDKKRTREELSEVYKNSGLGKWFHDESADSEPGWDRYDSKGNRIGKCGDSKPGEGKPKCLSKQKAARLRSKGGKKAIAAAVRRKRKKDPKQDRPGTGNKPINVSNNLKRKKTKRKLKEGYMNIRDLTVGSTVNINETICFVDRISRIGDNAYKVEYINEFANKGTEIFLKTDDVEVIPSELMEEKETKRKLNKPFRTPGGPKKFSVYVRNEKGNVVKVNFGDPNMEIKRDDPKRRKNFRARHNCSNPGPKTKARYWSCYQWRGSAPVADSIEYEGNLLSEKMNPTDHVKKKKNGMYAVYDKNNKEVKEFEKEKEANQYAIKNHSDLMEKKDHEYSMARSQISTAIKAAKKLQSKLKGEGNIEAWVQSKITKASDYLDAAADYMDSGEHDIEESSDCGCNKVHESHSEKEAKDIKKIAKKLRQQADVLDSIDEGILKTLAKKHDMKEEDIKNQLEMGIKVESEHTDDPTEATVIALDHLEEVGDYYSKLKKYVEPDQIEEGKNKNIPTNPKLWSQAKAEAKKKFDVYPSAYANAWAAKWYKKKGGGWKKGELKESYLQTKRMDKTEKTFRDMITKELEKTKAFKTINPRFKKDIHKEVSRMILIANDLLTKEKK